MSSKIAFPSKRVLLDYTLIIVGVILMAFAINVFYGPNNLVTGGFTGLSIIVESKSADMGFEIPVWITNLALNIPLFFVAVKAFGAKSIIRTIFATLFLSVALLFTKDIYVLQIDSDFILVPLFGGVLQGTGLGLIFRSMATTGGTDTVASIIHKRKKHIPVSQLMFSIDSCVILLGTLLFGPIKGMYAVVAVFVCTKVVNAVLEGMSFAKAAFIISDKFDLISDRLMKDMNRGMTGLLGKGMYTGTEKFVGLCVVSTKEIVRVKELVYGLDENAFIMVADIREVLGNGFRRPEN